MAINIVDLPAPPRCGGGQWSVDDRDQLVMLTGMIMLGRAEHAAEILDGALADAPIAAPAFKAKLRSDLVIPANADPAHRDGLLFESICWLVAKIEATPDEAIADPHRKATQQGADGLKVRFDAVTRQMTTTTVYEYKCSGNARRKFKREVLPAFENYKSGIRDGELAQGALALLSRFGLTQVERKQAYERLILDRPLAFEAALTVSPGPFPANKCNKLFKDYEGLNIPIANRRGNTFPVPALRPWFDAFATDVWAWIDVHV